MSLWRALLVAGGGGAFTSPPVADVFEVLAAPNGAWPGATQAFYNPITDSTLFGIISSTGSVRIGEWDHATDTGSSVEVGVLDGDQHNSPGLLRRSSDGRYVSVMCNHNANQMYVNISTNPDDNSAWAGTFTIGGTLGGSGYTYPHLFQLTGEASDPIYLFYRNVTLAGSSEWTLAKSTDGGETWGNIIVLWNMARAYARCVQASDTRLDFFFTDGTWAEDEASLYHVYYDGGWFDSDGNSITPGFTTSEATPVYSGATAGVRYPNDAWSDGTTVACVFPVQTGTPAGHIGEDEDYLYARWDGASWSVETIQADVGATEFEFTEGGLCIDTADVDTVYLSKRVAGGSGTWNIWRAIRTSPGSWSQTQLTDSSSLEHRYPWSPVDHDPGLLAIWQFGTFTTEDDFDVGVRGYGT